MARKTPLLALVAAGFLASVLASGFVVGCANMRAPSGGPADETDPFVTQSSPDSAATLVVPTDSLAIVFSEPMKKRTVEEAFRITPPVEFRSIEWEADTLTFLLTAPLDTATTYVGLLGGDASDRRGRKMGNPWSWPFSTGSALDPGTASGQLHGGRFKPGGLFLYVWPWEDGPPDTTESYYPPDPIRFGQTNTDGTFAIDFLPAETPLRICAFYDRDKDGSFQPLPDRWACVEEPVVIPDSSGVLEEIEIFLAESEEPGTIEGTVVDSLCLAAAPGAVLKMVRAERDSLLEWLSGEYDARQRGRGTLTVADSIRIEREMAEFVRLETRAKDDSLLCAQPIRVELVTGDSLVSETSGPDFRFAEVDPGIYRVRAYRDTDQNAERSMGEAMGRYPFALEVLPLRVLDELEISLRLPEGETLLRPLPPEPAVEDSLP
ncbi:MAG: Ig-like domain-containing protein [Candidatus Eisenbacteria bacterium]